MKKTLFLLLSLGFTVCFSQTKETAPPSGQGSSNESKTSEQSKPALYPGGIPAFMRDVSKAIKVNRVRVTKKGAVQSKAKFSVGTDGVIDQVIMSGDNEDLNREVERVLKTMKTKWTPGELNGKPAPIWYAVPIIINF